MKKLYEKNQLTFAIVWIVIYCILQSLANSLNEIIGIPYSANAVFCILQAVILFVFIRKNGLMKRYGLCKASAPACRFLFYIPLIIFASGNLWHGVTVNYSPMGTVCRVAAMLCVGFTEEIIFRGFLFKAIAKNNIKTAVIVSSLTFGIGHLINLFNGNSLNLVSSLCQIAFAVAAGFMLVTIFYRGGSLIPCIIAHAANNIASTFADESWITTQTMLIHCLILIVITVGYTLILTKTLPKAE